MQTQELTMSVHPCVLQDALFVTMLQCRTGSQTQMTRLIASAKLFNSDSFTTHCHLRQQSLCPDAV